MKLETMRPEEFRRAVSEKWPVFVVFGAMEYHGEHLPLGTDTLIARGIVERIAQKVPVVEAPDIPAAPTMHWAGGVKDGDMHFSGEVLLSYVREYLKCLLAYGFDQIYVLLGHQGLDGDPGTIVKRAYWDLTEKEAETLEEGWGRYAEKHPEAANIFGRVKPVLYDQFCDYSKVGDGNRLLVGHAGKGESQLMMAMHPDTVCMKKLENSSRPLPDWLSDVYEASAEEGQYWVDICVDSWAEYLAGNRR